MKLGAGGAAYQNPRPWDAALERCSSTLRVVCRNRRNNLLKISLPAFAPQHPTVGRRHRSSAARS
jgi:hypothetical protein